MGRTLPVDKVVGSFDEAVADIADGSLIHLGGFGGPAECPSYLIAALARRDVRELTITGNQSGFSPDQLRVMQDFMAPIMRYPDDYYSPGLLVSRGQVRKGILTFPVQPGRRMKLPFETLLEEGRIEVELVGQGTLAERIRAARAGIAAFYTPVGPGTIAAVGKEIREFDGRPHVLEHALHADVSIIRAHRADRWGNLVYRGSARTINATMAGAATVTIAEVDEVVPLGDLDPDHIVTPAPFVQRVVERPRPPTTSWETAC